MKSITQQNGSHIGTKLFSSFFSAAMFMLMFTLAIIHESTFAQSTLWGITSAGGANSGGVIFKYDQNANTYTDINDLSGATGDNPVGSLLRTNDGTIYGMTNAGGANGVGAIFKYNVYTSTYTDIYDFATSTGANPVGSLIQASDGNFYGVTSLGGVNGVGVLFQFNPNTNTYSKNVDMDSAHGATPAGSLIEANPGYLYGMTTYGGYYRQGVIFDYNISTNTYTDLKDFYSSSGKYPVGSFVESGMKLYGVTRKGGTTDVGTILEYDITNNNYPYTIDLGHIGGSTPLGSLVVGNDGNIYGTTSLGGNNGAGLIFKITPPFNYIYDTLIKLYSFSSSTGANPNGSLMIASNGSIYGMTNAGGANNAGVIYQYISSSNTYTKKSDMASATGSSPASGNLLEVYNCNSPVDQSETISDNQWSTSPGYYVGQSFTAGMTGFMTKFGLKFMNAGKIIIDIFKGADVYGTKLYTTDTLNVTTGWNDIPVSPAINITADSVYTFKIEVYSPTSYISIASNDHYYLHDYYTGGNLYWSAQGNYNNTTLNFKTYISQLPVVTWNTTYNGTCYNASPVTLSGVSPSGGIFSGTGVSGGVFNPSIGIGTYDFTYTYTDTYGCSNYAKNSILVDSIPAGTVTSNAGTSFCLGAGVLSGPIVGQTGETNFVSDPSNSGGTHTICDCPAGYVAVGIQGRLGADIDQMSLICKQLLPNGTLGQNTVLTNSAGISTGGSAFGPFDLPPNNIMIGGTLDYGYGFIDGVQLFGQSVSYILNDGTNTNSPTSTVDEYYLYSQGNGTLYVPNGSVVTGMEWISSQYTPIFSSSIAWRYKPISSFIYNYFWSTGETTATITPASSGTYSLTVSNGGGCSNTGSIAVTVNPIPTVTITPSGATSFCAPGSVTLDAGTQFAYLWSNGATTESITVSTSGTYSVTVSNVYNCTSTASQVVTVYANPIPTITANGATTFCNGSSVDLDAGGGYLEYSWSDGSTTEVLSAINSGTYTVTVSSAHGCTRTTSSPLITVNPLPQGSITASGPICVSGPAQLTWTATAGTGPFTVVYNDGTADQTVTNVISGTPFNVATVPVTTANYLLISVSDINCSRTTGFTDSTATIVVNTPMFTACPDNAINQASTSNCTAIVNYTSTAIGSPAPTISYTFTGATTGSGSGTGSGSTFNVGTTVVTITAQNSCTSIYCIFNVIITTGQAPVFTSCPSNISVSTDPNECSAVVNFNTTATATCGGIVNITQGQNFNYTGSVQTFTVPAGITSININAIGAGGGNDGQYNSTPSIGGAGASISGDFIVTPGQIIYLMVGQKGEDNFMQDAGGGGGGGTFVTTDSTFVSGLLIAAGGGGGASYDNAADASTSTNGTDGSPDGNDGTGTGGINGNGGTNGNNSGGGAGWLSNGSNTYNNVGGISPSNGGAGGAYCNGGIGGYGGGGSSCGGGGGGGGYSGGGGGGDVYQWQYYDWYGWYYNFAYYVSGGSGGSFNGGANQVNTAGVNHSNGTVTISWNTGSVASPLVTATSGLASGSAFPKGTTVETFIAKDASGNTTSCSFNVTVSDTTPPTFATHSNITVNNDSSLCSAVVTFNNPTATDNCGGILSSGNTGLESFAYTGSVQSFTVPAGVNNVNINALGGGGGNDIIFTGGAGASMSGNFGVTSGQILYLLIGQRGGDNSNYDGGAGGGGGGTFITTDSTFVTGLLIAAGGGGGAGAGGGNDANISTDGSNGDPNTYAGEIYGGTNGYGGNTLYFSGGGAGWLSDGANDSYSCGNTGGLSPADGGAGGGNCTGGTGGYGGGGSAANGGGGGGGYSGGAGGDISNYYQAGSYGGGGGSYNTGTNQVNTAGVNHSDGMAIISWGDSVAAPLVIHTSGLPSGSAFPIGTTTETYTATDASGNTSTCSFTVTVNLSLQGSLTANGPFCGSGNGQLTWTATGGTGPFTIVYNDGTANRTATGVASGTPFNVYSSTVTSTTTYTLVSVSDIYCTRNSGFTNGSATIVAHPVPNPSITETDYSGSTNNDGIICNGSSATLNTGSFNSYSWSCGNATTQSITVAPTNSTTYTVTVSNGYCTATASTTITVNSAPTAASTAGSIACNGGTTTINVSATGGTTPYTGTGINTVTSGSYTYTVTDVNGCKSSTSQSITQPTAVTFSTVVTNNSSCTTAHTASIAVTGSGGTGMKTYSDNGGTSYQGASLFSTLANGTYSVKVKDANSCLSGTSSIVITSSPGITFNTSVVNASNCSTANGKITVTATGGAGAYNYSKNGGTVYQSSNIFNLLLPGTYSVKVKDPLGCVSTVTSVSVNSNSGACRTMTDEAVTSSSNTFSVYPNPASDAATILFSSDKTDGYTIRMIDVTGRMIFSQNGTSVIGENQYQMNLSELAKGIYLVILQNGDEVFQNKLVVQ